MTDDSREVEKILKWIMIEHEARKHINSMIHADRDTEEGRADVVRRSLHENCDRASKVHRSIIVNLGVVKSCNLHEGFGLRQPHCFVIVGGENVWHRLHRG